VVRVGCRAQQGDKQYTDWGSGTIIARNGTVAYVLTCWHTFRDYAATGRPLVYVGRQGYWAKIEARDKRGDLVLLKIKDPGIPPIDLAQQQPQIGQIIHTAGYPQSEQYREVAGHLLSPAEIIDDPSSPIKTIRVSGSVSDGVSGGPMLNRQNQLVAVCWGSVESNIYGVPLPRIRAFLQGLLPRPEVVNADPPLKSDTWQIPPPQSDTWRPPPPLVAVTPPVPAVSPIVVKVEATKWIQALGTEVRSTLQQLDQFWAAREFAESNDRDELRARIMALEKVVAALKCDVQVKPLIVKRVNTVTGEETIEEINFQDGEGLIFLMTPHQ